VKPELRHVGTSRTPVVVVDEFSGNVRALIDIAAGLAPFPYHRGNYYPGLRRIITETDAAANAYVERALNDAAQFIAGAYDVDRFHLLEASFSMVVADPSELMPAQRAPHFDTTDPKHYALLHYLNVPTDSGTAFYRHRATGVERVTDYNIGVFVPIARKDAASLPANSGYILGDNEHYEQIEAIEAVPDRLIIYPGSLLHSGIIPPGMNLSHDPHVGRLTANFFVRGH
jgi:hypothetical protein